MGILLCLLLLIAAISAICPDGYKSGFFRCYKVYETPLTYFAAADACTLVDAQLVSIHNAFENSYVTGLIENKYADHWIGLTSMISGWNYTWLDNTVFNYDRFSPSPPNHNFNCVAIKPVSTTWTTESCSNELPFICIFDPAVDRNCPVCPSLSPCPTCPPPPVCNVTVYSAGSARLEYGSISSKDDPGIIEPSLLKSQSLDSACPVGYTYLAQTQRCYKVVGDAPKTLFAASNACNLDDAELVSIHSLEESQQIGALLPDSDKIFWIGLTNLVNNWGQWTWLDGTAVLYGNWADGKPDNNMSCAVMHSLGYQWNTENCQLLLPYICKFDPSKIRSCPPCVTQGPCPACPTYEPCPQPLCDSGWKYYDHTGFCYLQGRQPVINTDAQNFCRNHGAYLASIHSDAENSFILNYIYSEGVPSDCWIGLYRTGSGVTAFANYDGTPMDYTNWNSGEPNNSGGNEYCTVIYIDDPVSGFTDQKWNDESCPTKLSYVCKKPANKQ